MAFPLSPLATKDKAEAVTVDVVVIATVVAIAVRVLCLVVAMTDTTMTATLMATEVLANIFINMKVTTIAMLKISHKPNTTTKDTTTTCTTKTRFMSALLMSISNREYA